MSKQKLKLVVSPQHACFVASVAGGDMLVTVYSKTKKRIKAGDVNWALDQAKDKLLGRVEV